MGYSPCFRREAGSYGKETQGLIRVHQFDKVEMVKFVQPDTLLRRAGVCCSATPRTSSSAWGWPIACWSWPAAISPSPPPSATTSRCGRRAHERWLEVSSCSNFEDFQARRAGIRFKPKGGGKVQFAHTLNGSGLALPRTVIALVETYQTERGTVLVPEALRPYMDGVAELS